MMRIDRLLVERGLAESRNQAQAMILSGRVWLVLDGQNQQILKVSHGIDERAEIHVRDVEGPEYVSRGGIKMRGALQHTGLKVHGFTVLDIGISTGGFTDCLLQAGAAGVVGIDVGHGQLAPRLKTDPRIRLFEGINARTLSSSPFAVEFAEREFDLIVVDVSFISLCLVLPEIIHYLCRSHAILALVKPQFEVGREGLGKNGIVKDPALYGGVREKILAKCAELGLKVEDYFASPIEGSDGNREFFLYATKP